MLRVIVVQSTASTATESGLDSSADADPLYTTVPISWYWYSILTLVAVTSGFYYKIIDYLIASLSVLISGNPLCHKENYCPFGVGLGNAGLETADAYGTDLPNPRN